MVTEPGSRRSIVIGVGSTGLTAAIDHRAPDWLIAKTVARGMGRERWPLREKAIFILQWIRWEIQNRTALVDGLVAWAAIIGMTASVLCDLPVQSTPSAGSDMKTLFASAWCLVHGLNAYTVAHIQSVFTANHVVLPESWFAHSPVYPPLTLALLAPLTFCGMVPAVYGMVVLSAALFALALVALLRNAAESDCPFAGRIAIAILCASCPLFAFALSVGNVSVAASALAILAFVRRKHGGRWIGGLMLAVAVVLKPHLALWMLIGMLLLPERASRAIAVRAIAIAGGFGALVAAIMALAGDFRLQMNGLAAILRTEISSGSSMNPGSKEVLPIYAQITSLQSLLGFWWKQSPTQTIVLLIILLALGAAAAWRIRSAQGEDDAVPAIGAWMAFGLLATYHRAHDAVLLLLLLPWLVKGVVETPRRWYPWAIAVAYAAMNFSASPDRMEALIMARGYSSLATFVLLRQAAIADLVLVLLLLMASFSTKRRYSRKASPIREAVFAS